MDAPTEFENPTDARECDKKPMRHFAETRQNDLKSAKTPMTHGNDVLPSKTPDAPPVVSGGEMVTIRRSKSIAVYIFIAAGIMACLVWSAALFWLLLKVIFLLTF